MAPASVELNRDRCRSSSSCSSSSSSSSRRVVYKERTKEQESRSVSLRKCQLGFAEYYRDIPGDRIEAG
jgi:hypothetical protein